MSRDEPMVLVDVAVRTPPGRDFWTTEDMYDPVKDRPSWGTGMMALTFFALSRHSIVRWIKLGYNISDFTGEVSPPRTDSGGEPYRWRLWDIERLAHAAASHKVLSGAKLSRSILMVKTSAELHGYL